MELADPLRTFLERYGAFNADSQSHWIMLILIDSILLLTLFTLLVGMLALALRRQYSLHLRKWNALHQKWDTKLLDVLGGDAPASELQALVDSGQELDFVRLLAPYGYRLRGSDLAILAGMAEHFLPFVSERLQHHSPGVRIWALNVLNMFGMPQHENMVASKLNDPSPAVSMFAATTLLAHQRSQFTEQIIEQLPRFDQWNIHALAALLVRAGPAIHSMLETVYLDHRRPLRTRVIAAEALGHGNAYRALNSALLTLGAETNQDILVATLHMLARISQGRHVESVRSLCRSPNDVLRINAMATMRQLATANDLPLFRQAMLDANPWVARQAALALFDLGDLDFLQHSAAAGNPAESMLARYVLATS